MAASPGSLHAADYVIFVGMLIITLSIGIYHAWAASRIKTTSEYLVGSRNLRTLPVSISLMASFISSILMLGFPAETYTGGVVVWWQFLGICFGALMSVSIFVPTLYPLKLTSVNQYLYMRYKSTFISILGTCASLCFLVLYTGVVYYAPATALKSVTGFPTWGSIMIGSGITILYTTIGGFKAVIWTDVFQAIVMVCCLLAITIKGIMNVGSLEKMWQINKDWERLNFFVFNPDPTLKNTFWSLTFGLAFSWITFYGTSQTAVQRYSSLRSLTQARLCVIGVLPGVTFMITLATLAGLAIFAFYTSLGCDPLRGDYLDNPNQLVPHFLMDALNVPGIPGLLFAGVTSASLSTASSNLNAAAANVWDDIMRKIWPNLSENKNVIITKSLVVFFGVLSTAIAFAVSFLGGTVIQSIITFSSAIGGPTTAMFLLGVLIPFANWIGSCFGWLLGFVFGLWVGFGSYTIKTHKIAELSSPTYNCSAYVETYRPWLTDTSANLTGVLYTTHWPNVTSATSTPESDGDIYGPLYKLYSVSYLWLALMTMAISFTVGLIASCITGGMRGETVQKRHLHPFIRRFAGVDDEDTTNNVINKEQELEFEKSYVNPQMDADDLKQNASSVTRM